jgi:hypothetical protein
MFSSWRRPMDFEILSAQGRHAARWTALIQDLPPAHHDVHYLPEYGRIYGDTYGFAPSLAVYEAEAGYVLQPFVLRPLKVLPFLADAPDAASFADIANPYGYGGPLCNAPDAQSRRHLYTAFAKAFASWCDEKKIASEFASLHPFMVQDQCPMIRDVLASTYEKDVVFIDLTADEESIIKQLRKGHRSSITLARRSGVRVEKVEVSVTNLLEFKAMYEATMARRQAAQRWFLPQDYFANTVCNLGEGRTSLLFAKVDGEIESGCLLMHDFRTAYYHFAATWAKRPELGVNNLLVFEAAIQTKHAGFTKLHLGGGVTSSPDDSLLRFKAGFSDRRAPLYTYFCVRNRTVYDTLCERKRAHERATIGQESISDFLPLYRR